MKALTVKQPWAWWLFHGKLVENRGWHISGSLPQRIAVHAGKARDIVEFMDAHEVSGVRVMPDDVPIIYGAIIGSVEVVSCYADKVQTPWDVPGHWHWRIAHVHEYADPIPCRGQLSLWTVPAALMPDIEAQERAWEAVK